VHPPNGLSFSDKHEKRRSGHSIGSAAQGLAGNGDLYGNANKCTVFGNHGDDIHGDDDIYGGDGKDRIIAGRGGDLGNVQGDGRVDRVDCGFGHDVVRANP
jgi:Ca2+-binding RTX toxin-like protein